MELIISYDSDSSDNETKAKKLKKDFFNLEESDEEDKYIENDIMCQAALLKSELCGPLSNTYSRCDVNADASLPVSTYSLDSTPLEKRSKSYANKIAKLNIQKNVDKVDSTEIDIVKPNIEIQKESIFLQNCDISKSDKNFIPQKIFYSFEGHSSMVSSLFWNNLHSNLLLSSSMDSTLKIWNILSFKCVKDFKETSGIKSAKWTLCGKEVIYGGYDKKVNVLDVDSGICTAVFPTQDFIFSIEIHPEMPDVFLVGTKDNVLAFDKRDNSLKTIRIFSSNCQHILDLAFMKMGAEFIASTEVVSHDCADRTIMVWDFVSGAILSNQIYGECYTCPCIKVPSEENYFVAQSNGNYIAVFSTRRPYKLQNRRFMSGHEVAGYSIGCDFSPNSRILVSGDAKGGLYFYNNANCNLIKKINAKCDVPLVRVNWHPLMSSVIATGYYDGSIQLWQ